MKALIVYNPFSRSKRVAKNINYIKDKLKIKYDNVDDYSSKCSKDLIGYIKNNSANYDLIIACGGDGTINEVINGLLSSKSKTPLSIIPTGTINDLSSMLGFSKSIKKSLKIILEGEDVFMDACKINDQYFTYAAACGKYTDVSYSAPRHIKRIFGPLAYFFQGVHEFPKYTKMDLKISIDDYVLEDRFYVILALNTIRIAGFKIKRYNQVKLNDGIIDFTMIQKRKVSWTRLAKFFVRGDNQMNGVKTIHGKNIRIESSENIKINTDGEFCFSSKKIDIQVLNKVLNVRISKKTKDLLF